MKADISAFISQIFFTSKRNQIRAITANQSNPAPGQSTIAEGDLPTPLNLLPICSSYEQVFIYIQ